MLLDGRQTSSHALRERGYVLRERGDTLHEHDAGKYDDDAVMACRECKWDGG